MNLFRIFPKSVVALAGILLVSSCNFFDLDINTDPNNPSAVNPELLLSSAQINMAYNMNTFSDVSQGFNGQLASYDNWTLNNNSFPGTWSSMYANVLKDVEGLIAATEASGDRAESSNYLGVAKILKGYLFGTMVDMWGDVPFSEALKGDASEVISQPKFDKDAQVYDACLVLLDEGIELLDKGSAVKVAGDAIYAGSTTKWQKFARSVKLKMLMNKHNADASVLAQIEALVADPTMLINSSGEDFQFNYGKLDNPDYRHPWYQAAYAGTSNGFTYILHQPMVEMLEDRDPRWPFYFHRQTSSILDQTDPTQRNTTPCSNYSGCEYGYIVLNQPLIDQIYPNDDEDPAFLAGIFGRDAGDPSGTPSDESYRTLPGVYPCGGFHDAGATESPSANAAPGGGIQPMLTYVNVLYLRTEAAMRLGTTGDARALFESAIGEHISKVVSFGTATDAGAVAPDAAVVDAYVALWLGRYDDAANENARFNVVAKQCWFSSWGNAVELYNMKRRTGFPTGIQQPLESNDRGYPLRLPYPQTEISLNPNAAAYSGTVYDADHIFWDN